MNTKNKTLLGILAATLICGCEEEDVSTRYVKHDVDQVFRDHNGYRIYYDDENHIVQERIYCEAQYYKENEMYWPKLPLDIPATVKSNFRYLNVTTPGVIIIKDLNAGEQGYANVLLFKESYNGYDFKDGCGRLGNHVEIHLPASQELNAGIDKIEGQPRLMSPKVVGRGEPEYPPMKEIK